MPPLAPTRPARRLLHVRRRSIVTSLGKRENRSTATLEGQTLGATETNARTTPGRPSAWPHGSGYCFTPDPPGQGPKTPERLHVVHRLSTGCGKLAIQLPTGDTDRTPRARPTPSSAAQPSGQDSPLLPGAWPVVSMVGNDSSTPERPALATWRDSLSPPALRRPRRSFKISSRA